MFQIRHNPAAQTDAAALCRRDAPPPAKAECKGGSENEETFDIHEKVPKGMHSGSAFKLLEAAFELFVPLIVAAIIDNGIDGKSKSFIINMGLLLLALAAVGLLCSVTAHFSRQRLQSASAPTFAPLC